MPVLCQIVRPSSSVALSPDQGRTRNLLSRIGRENMMGLAFGIERRSRVPRDMSQSYTAVIMGVAG
jgi:hypothetical protein